jgi:hypothetical protein
VKTATDAFIQVAIRRVRASDGSTGTSSIARTRLARRTWRTGKKSIPVRVHLRSTCLKPREALFIVPPAREPFQVTAAGIVQMVRATGRNWLYATRRTASSASAANLITALLESVRHRCHREHLANVGGLGREGKGCIRSAAVSLGRCYAKLS